MSGIGHVFQCLSNGRDIRLNGLAVSGVLYPNFKTPIRARLSAVLAERSAWSSAFYTFWALLILGLGTTGFHSHTGWVIGSVDGFALLSWLVGWLPFRLGLRQLEQFEF
jgi:hypothetical protein